jgi:hypothetical protein
LSERGVRIGSKLYPYLTLKSFWVEDLHDFLAPKLLITSQKPMTPHIAIPLPETIDSQEVRRYLLPHLAEEEQHESFAHHLSEMLGL